MNIPTKDDGEIRGIGWLAGSTGTLLLISIGLELLAHQVFGKTDVATLLWALYLAFWSCVLGIVGFLILSISWLMDWWCVRTNRVAMSRNSTTEPRQQDLEKPMLEAPQFLQPGMASLAPSPPSRESDEKDTPKSFTRVA
jgi:hypothetical protein